MCYSSNGKEIYMKKLIVCIGILCLSAGIGFTQSATNLDDFKNGISNFAEDLGSVLPMNTVIGLNWNDAYIGDVVNISPHFGIGLTTGFTTLPYKRIRSLVENAMGGDSEDIPGIIRKTGVPIPAAAIDARIGGFLLPVDLGIKLGYFSMDSSDLKIDYLLVGGDVRYCVMDQAILIPKISVGFGFNYMKTDIKLSNALGDDITIDIPATYSGLTGISSLDLTSPDLYMEMETKVFDFKTQASWKFLVFEPSIGLGASYGISKVYAGAESKLTKNNGKQLSQKEKEALSSLGFDIDDSSIGYTKNVRAFAYRVFGGMGFNLSIVRLDFGLMYGMNSGSWGATFGGRIQI